MPLNIFFRCLVLLGLAVALSACDLPRDPESTLEHVRGGELRVGVVDNAPWARAKDGSSPPQGAEVDLVNGLAKQLDSKIVWHRGPEEELMEGLEYFQIDLVIGGVKKRSPWRKMKHIGSSRAYHKTRDIVAVPAGVGSFSEIDGQKIAVKRASPLIRLIKERGGKPKPMPEAKLRAANTAVAGPAWKLKAWGLKPTEIKLRTNQHIWGTPPGENGWIYRLDQFLHANRARVPKLLSRHLESADAERSPGASARRQGLKRVAALSRAAGGNRKLPDPGRPLGGGQ